MAGMLLSNVVVTGGNACLPGFTARMYEDAHFFKTIVLGVFEHLGPVSVAFSTSVQ